MENSLKNSVNNGLSKILYVCSLSLLFVLSFGNQLFAQSDSPSVDNLKNNMSANAKQLEQDRHDEIMSYVYMAFGFAVVIAIAWSTTVMARKRNRRQLEEKQRYILKQQELKKHHNHGHAGHAAHGHGVKARR
jgi:beta-lactamase regulating signal transducer with metallopeptidase domain